MMTPISTNRIHTVRLLSGRMRESKIITTVSEISHTPTWTLLDLRGLTEIEIVFR